jgi:hypothetical protein
LGEGYARQEQESQQDASFHSEVLIVCYERDLKRNYCVLFFRKKLPIIDAIHIFSTFAIENDTKPQ